MPAYNSEKFISASIQSILDQTYTNWELIVVDDGSTDNTGEIIKEFAQVDNRINYFYQDNGRQAEARNYAISMAKGEILAFLDSDDLWLPQKLEISLQYLLKSEADLLFTDAYFFCDESFDIFKKNYSVFNIPNFIYSGDDALKLFIEMNKVPILTVLVYKSKVISVGGFDSYCIPAEDYDLWIRLLKSGAVFKAISFPLSAYRFVNKSSSSSDRLSTTAIFKILAKNFEVTQIKRLGLIHIIKTWILRFVFNNLSPLNYDQLDRFIRHFELDNKIYKVVFKLRKIIGFRTFVLALRVIYSKKFGLIFNI